MALVASIHVDAGWVLPDASLKTIDGDNVNLHQFMGEKGLLVVFTCNHCPYAKAVWPRLVRHAKTLRELGVAAIAVNSNIHPDYPEDSVVAMQRKISEWSIDFPYLADESQDVARVFDAQCTPDIYMFDADAKLFYHGRIDNYWKDECKVTREELIPAAQAMVLGKAAPVPQHPSIGCSIKWKEEAK
ncbi:MAG: thioredoxin family protein [Zetaproteobacteria bacterium CG02_land_8_20_14_3_00_50_9]|nr:MAG: thioredoxin family protein [Zetaproteobacteria bacterium CG1_02_53_45]PIQ32374.1 MAG: thioredoxin family protein [Zetaproteobacteria bacterium CG17_big_fil_post_rev_8_21_14_2_50_50_13]PIV30796.1 MAG: thioredoxin family protein [Zetaproteobacteria bacterium CG02_land_8_20_14_3_00_50_9]PIY54686.1 MAG: thioredoxin family protein [Zetaproteobacteria bacterium CG_4_10_14_0_8_um_filter_49_80]